MNKEHSGHNKLHRLPLLLLGILSLAFAPKLSGQVQIKGRIINFAQVPIAFASIVHKESGTGTAADEHGNFSLEIKNSIPKGNLLVSAVGYDPREVDFDVRKGQVDFKLIHLTENNQEIQEVIITGEVKPTPVDSSIYKVKLISSEQIQRSGSQNLNELLMTEANIRMSTDLVLGSQIEMLGLHGQNVKIMVDGVPVIGRLDGNIDLSQVNLDNIAQVEVVEGPMSVVYGNNALAGTINLITKQNTYHSLEANAKAYAESVGRYSGNLSVSQKTGKNIFMADGGYEYFSGVDFDKSDRSMNWKPKNLYRFNLGHTWKNNSWQVNTKLGYYNDRLHYKGNIFKSDQGYRASDTYYYTNRYDASIGANGSWNDKNSLNVVASYNIYKRYDQKADKDFSTLEEFRHDKEKSQDMNQKMLRAIHSHTFLPKKLLLQSGIDFNLERMEDQKRVKDEKQSLGDYAVFANLRYSPYKTFEFQPGLRYAYNTDYDSPLVYSLNLKWNIAQKLTWRASVAKGFRAPSLKELYYIFKDSNHDIVGNSELEAESSYNYNSSLEFVSQQNNHAWKLNVSAYFNDINDMIALAQKGSGTNLQYTYMNIEKFESIGGDISADYGYKGLIKLRAGYGLTGRYNLYTTQNNSSKYNVTHDVFGSIKLTEPRTRITFNADYKYNGAIPFFYTKDKQIKEGEQESYHTMNTSVSKSFFKHQMMVILGVKNLFDITSVKYGGISSSAHSDGSGEGGTPISYGRSFFITLNYKLYK